MKFKSIVCFSLVITFAITDLSVACGGTKNQNQNQKQNRTKREDGPDFAGMAASGAATAIELIQKGAAVKHGFHAKIGEEN